MDKNPCNSLNNTPSAYRFLNALRRQPVDTTPVWLMRQAGRYLPEYRQLRAKAGDFLTLCKTPELACEITLQPLQRFPLDAAIIFSDILTIPDAMGLGLQFVENEGPKFIKPIRSAEDIRALAVPDMDKELRYVMDALRLVRKELAGKVPLIGFSGSPWTLATYMIEGGASKTFSQIKRWLFTDSVQLHHLLGLLASAIEDYLVAQAAAGAQAVMIFDTWGGILTPRDYEEFSCRYMQTITTGFRRRTAHHSETIPVILFTKNGGQWLEKMADSGCDALGIDWTTDLAFARAKVGHKVALQGNMDPAVLFASPTRIEQEVMTILSSYGRGSGHIFNLGHGVLQETPPENVAVLVDAVHRLGTQAACRPCIP